MKRVVVAGGFLFLCAAPRLIRGQSTPAVPVQPTRTNPASARNRNRPTPPDLLAGLTLTGDQKAKIDQIRADTKSHLAAVVKDDKLGPEVKDAMLGGFQRIENSKIFAVLTPEQQQQVRRQMSAWRATAQQPQNRLRQPSAPERNSQAQ